jgi:hypothetical protein
VRGAAALILGPVALSAGCAVAAGLDSQTGKPGTGGGSEPTRDSSVIDAREASALPAGDAQFGEANADVYTNALGDAWTDGGADAEAGVGGDAASPVDAAASEAADAGDDGAGDSSADASSSDAWASDGDVGQDAGDVDVGADALPEAGLDSGLDADAAGDSGCSGPHVAILTPATGTTIAVSTRNPSTDYFTFSAHVDFCAPMQSVTFDYSGPTGLVSQQETVFTSYANTFAQQTQVGGTGPSLATYGGSQNPSSWVFVVTAVDVNNQSTVAQASFTLLVTGHGQQ